jgi:hypothetical protein
MAYKGAIAEGTPLVTYRRTGGMAGLNQRLTVFEDGRVRLEDRRARGRSEVTAAPGDVDALRAALDAVPDEEWHGWAGALMRRSMPRGHAEGMRFEVRCARGRVTGHAGRHDAELAAVLGSLDELLARAVRERRG